MSIRKDYIERLIEQFAAALARILKAHQQQRPEEARRLVRDTALSALGMHYDALLLGDAATTARMLGDAPRVKVLARLVAEDGEALHQQGDAPTARERFRYALALYAEARALGLPPDAGDTPLLERLQARVSAP
jgi:tetratricopeptide (TPR) repeat protein